MSLLDKIFAAGVVGCGGAGFPTHAKLAAKVDFLLLNGAECEPLLRTDRYLMLHRAPEMVAAVEACRVQVEAREAVFLLKSGYREEIKALQEAITQSGLGSVRLHTVESFYPAGDEQVVVHEVTGRVVPPAGIPLDVGCVVSNVATMLAVYEADKGIPFTHKYLTITGEVARPLVARVPVGTAFGECIALAGGTRLRDYCVVSGGPMMGAVYTRRQAEAAVVTKTTSGLLVLPADNALAAAAEVSIPHMINRAGSACIQCSFCTQLCPRYLLGHPLEPHRIMRKLASGGSFQAVLDDPDVRNAQLCCECGICELYACPMQLQPRRVNAQLKALLAEAGHRLPKGQGSYTPDPSREDRKVPTHRAAVRAGVGAYYHTEIAAFAEHTPSRVELPLGQHIGAPSQPVVHTGDRVTPGQLVAVCPEGKLGANLHASIGGTVTVGDGSIIIQGKQG